MVVTHNTLRIHIGYVGEEDVRQINFSGIIASLKDTYGSGSAAMLHKREGDENSYPVVLTNGIWTVSDADNAVAGVGECQLVYTPTGKKAVTRIWQTVCQRSLLDSEGDPPDPYESWVSELTELGADIQADLTLKQDKLTAGANITITEEGVISAAGGGGGGGSVDAYTKAETDAMLSEKQNTLSQQDKQAIAALHTDAVTSVNGQTGAVNLTIPAAYDDSELRSAINQINTDLNGVDTLATQISGVVG